MKLLWKSVHILQVDIRKIYDAIFLWRTCGKKKNCEFILKKFLNSETRVPLLPPTLVLLLSMIMSRYMMKMMMAMMTVMMMMMMMIVGASKSYVQERRQEGFGSVRDPRGERRCPSTQYIHIPFSFSVTFLCNHWFIHLSSHFHHISCFFSFIFLFHYSSNICLFIAILLTFPFSFIVLFHFLLLNLIPLDLWFSFGGPMGFDLIYTFRGLLSAIFKPAVHFFHGKRGLVGKKLTRWWGNMWP